MFDPVLLRSFLAVIDCGGFTQAGRRLHATQSTISGHVKRLESLAGHRLLERTRRGALNLTPQGEIFVPYAREILLLQEAARNRLSDTPVSGIVRLGMSDDFASGRGFTRLLADFAHQHPDAQLVVRVDSSAILVAAVAAGELDYALAKHPGVNGDGELLAQHEVVWAAGSAVGTMSDPIRLVLFPAPCAYRTLALNALRQANRNWTVSYTSPSLGGIKAALAAGLGVSPLARDLLTGDLHISSGGDVLPRLGTVGLFLHGRPTAANTAANKLGVLLRSAFGPARPTENGADDGRM